jgi:hypothetical protein
MIRELVCVHGRSQQLKDPGALKAEWVAAFKKGLSAAGLELPLSEAHIRFPYYGDTLAQLTAGVSPENAAHVVVRGMGPDAEEAGFVQAVVEELRLHANMSEAEVAAEAGRHVVDRGPQNWEWVQAVLRVLDRKVPGASGASIALATRDVYKYLKDDAVQQVIDNGVCEAFTPGKPAVVVAHSLGTVVAYRLLRTHAQGRGWQVPAFVTLGSPLGVTAIRKTLASAARLCCPAGTAWFNAMDERDVVALYPLTPAHFPLNPALPGVENNCDVGNDTENHHGIEGYLSDPVVARRIYDALRA